MYGPYSAEHARDEKVIRYVGNKRSQGISDVQKTSFTEAVCESRVHAIAMDEHFDHLHRIDRTIFTSIVDYFNDIGADWCNLPQTTRMISSPGEICAGQVLNYTTDALPIELKWFDIPNKVYMSESSQFYLELRLLIKSVTRVFSIYNSFRKERADITHLSEFQHVEYEAKRPLEETIVVFVSLLRYITRALAEWNHDDLSFYLTDEEIVALSAAFDDHCIRRMTFADALRMLHEDTKDPNYREKTLKHFGAWEEIRLTQLADAHVLLTEYPLYEIPFYHASVESRADGRSVGRNVDFILYGYRETVGGGARIVQKDELMEKAEAFNLPKEDYAPYFEMRDMAGYVQTSGFGLGWQRYVHWLLKLPYIWDACHIPRGHFAPAP
jgi:asparaginyl-tRNA synthetase